MKALESKSLVLLRHHLKALRLPTIGAECEKVARRAASDGSDHLTYLLQVTELERVVGRGLREMESRSPRRCSTDHRLVWSRDSRASHTRVPS